MNTDCGYVSSRLVQTTGELRASLMRCVGAEKLVLYEGFGAVVDEQALDGYTGIPAPFHEAYRAVKRCIFQNSYPEATQIFAQYLSGCREHKVSPSFAFTASERFQNLLLIDYSLWIEQSKPSGADAPNSCLQPVTLEEHIHSFQQLLKTIRKNKTDFSSPSYRREINEIDRLIRENISRHISLSMLSRQVNMTENYISRLFKAETGVNIIYYINLMKLEHAKELLADSDENVKSIAMMLGFDEPSYFNKLFNKTYGVSPTEYRKLLWKQGYRESNTAGY